MGASGHIAGVINPPEAKKRSYWTRKDNSFPERFGDWHAKTQEHAGSWWTDWSAWLKTHAGQQIAAPKKYGRGELKAIEPAPGRYVKSRA
jgi:polyhydroxyalkanoate synthase